MIVSETFSFFAQCAAAAGVHVFKILLWLYMNYDAKIMHAAFEQKASMLTICTCNDDTRVWNKNGKLEANWVVLKREL